MLTASSFRLLAGGAALAALGAATLPALSGLNVSPSPVPAGTSATGVVVVSGANGVPITVTLASGDASLASVPAAVTVTSPSGAAGFQVHTPSTGAGCTTVSARVGSSAALSKVVYVSPQPRRGTFQLGLTPTTVVGGGTGEGVLTDMSTASNNAVVRLSSSNPGVTVPASVKLTFDEVGIPQASFPIHTSVVGAETCAVISATLGLTTQRSLLRIVSIGG